MTTITSTSETIACTLSADALRDVHASWQTLLQSSRIARDLVPGGLRLTVHPSAEFALRQLIDIEADCCRWITFELEGPRVAITAEGDGEQVIRAMWLVESSV